MRGEPCLGVGAVPIELDDARLAEAVEIVRAELASIEAELDELRRRRANWIPPHLAPLQLQLGRQVDRLARRLKRHRDWPARFAREMERHGYGMPPPAYLVERELAA